MLVCTLGDLLLDVVVRLDHPLVTGADTPARTTVVAGGQAANVAAWAAALGADSRLIAKLANDAGGRLATSTVARSGVDVRGPLVEAGTGIVVSLVGGDGERSMASDRGASATLRAEELDPAWFAGCDHLHVSGYCLATEPGRSAARRAVELARKEGATVSVDLAAAPLIEQCGPGDFREIVDALAPDAVFCNEDEERTIGGALSGTAWILKRGAAGAVFDGDARLAAPATVVDTTGAGDALAAGWIVGGPALALEAAARCVATIGAMPEG
jgi:sugar/nucleoside kinase (ribokinase family)